MVQRTTSRPTAARWPKWCGTDAVSWALKWCSAPLRGRRGRARFAVALLAGVAPSCSGDDPSSVGDACVAKADASVCAVVDEGALTLIGTGLRPGSVVRAVFDGEGPMELAVAGSGDLVNDHGAVGWLSVTPVRVVAIEATANDGSPLDGDITMP